MKNKANPLKIDKKLNKIIFIAIIFILFLSMFLLIYSFSSNKEKKVGHKNFGSNKLSAKVHRRFAIESAKDNIYNLGQYQVNLTQNQLLILNLSIRSSIPSFDTLSGKNIVIQNSVLESFSNYGSIRMPKSLSGKEQIKKNIQENINHSLGYNLVEEVYFNTFIIQ